ncbi:TPA: leucocin A/sakacin P family class II bacteriocin [Streptococcus equi subsp. zooepidemicus]|uniref:ComC/BlpC family leader-containing pheromone/bacteriocin n=3 Tax=Streptococcus equi TaxID=1336 RepID=A0A6M1L0G3_9STRE|nr:leucocin A/sakacin P family class II bacteriocin [Streptococcus equi]KIS16772.1 bacteriocin [Streptococcus equi subsp. zooepidemicus Sz4is]EQB23266.1 bacteriocin [Streptococcus equi subsp. zooepidemicus SzS31A1]KIS04980.1 bacteriocin [Streptococcus equi subsp. zooepidemicus Sz12is]KIS06042.1 bacteriocin [Streptococcus equi subsp. zooepidemicus Sz16]MCD3368487.1 class II bacteriocin [Streptococcus equi subsp. zooepidemicus]
MNTTLMKQFEIIDADKLAHVEGGKTTYYGNGLYCNTQKCWVNWSEAVNIILNNSVMNGLTGGNAGWHSGGII